MIRLSTMMTSVLQLFPLLFLISSVYAAATTAVTPYYVLHKDNEAEVVEAFGKSGYDAIDKLFDDYDTPKARHVQARIIEYGFSVSKKFENLVFIESPTLKFNFMDALLGGNVKVVEAYLKYKVDCNAYITEARPSFSSDALYNEFSNDRSYDPRTMTPLMVAVARADVEMVRMMVTSSFKHKLDLLKPRDEMEKLTARSIARKIVNYEKRSKILELLKIDPSKHDLTKSKKNTLEEDELNVKHVLSNSNLRTVKHLETVLMMGNYADKNDESIMLAGIRTNDYLIIEMLVMEGYAIPDNLPNPDFTIMRNQDDYELIMKIKDVTKRVPHPRRFRHIVRDYNEQCP